MYVTASEFTKTIIENRKEYSVFGKPQSGTLSRSETTLCEEANIDVPSDEVLYYSGLALSSSTVTVATRSLTSKRDNSCVRIVDHKGLVQWGLVQTIFSFKLSSSPTYYCLVQLLPTVSQQICTDEISNARLEDHLVACKPPWYNNNYAQTAINLLPILFPQSGTTDSDSYFNHHGEVCIRGCTVAAEACVYQQIAQHHRD